MKNTREGGINENETNDEQNTVAEGHLMEQGNLQQVSESLKQVSVFLSIIEDKIITTIKKEQ